MERAEYTKMRIVLNPQIIIDQYGLEMKTYKGFVYMKIVRRMYRLPQEGILSNKLLQKKLAKTGYFKAMHTPGLW